MQNEPLQQNTIKSMKNHDFFVSLATEKSVSTREYHRTLQKHDCYWQAKNSFVF